MIDQAVLEAVTCAEDSVLHAGTSDGTLKIDYNYIMYSVFKSYTDDADDTDNVFDTDVTPGDIRMNPRYLPPYDDGTSNGDSALNSGTSDDDLETGEKETGSHSSDVYDNYNTADNYNTDNTSLGIGFFKGEQLELQKMYSLRNSKVTIDTGSFQVSLKLRIFSLS